MDIEELQWHRWIFITESLELLQGIETGLLPPVSLVDKLSLTTNHKDQDSFTGLRQRGYLGHSKPLLTMRKIQDISELQPFFQHHSRHVYYSLSDPETLDFSALDQVILNDFLERSSEGLE